MLPLMILLGSFAVFRGFGLVGVAGLNNWDLPLRMALFVMFLMTASAHWGKGRADLIRMVPPAFPRAAAIVTVTGVLEILGAVGLLVPVTAGAAAICLAILLVAMFPANAQAARERLTIMGRPAASVAVRGAIQVIFVFALLAAAARHL